MPENPTCFYDFGTYRVDVSERLLLRGEEVVALTPKAFDMLLVLVESSGHVLTKEELMKRVWPDTIVEEANLSHNIYKLREALGEGRNGEKYIETLPRRGYRFVAKVTEIDQAPASKTELSLAEHTRVQVLIEETDEAKDFIPINSKMVSPEPRLSGLPQKAETRRKRWTVVVVSCALLAAMAFGAYQLIKTRKPTSAGGPLVRSIAVLPFKPLVADNHDAALELGMTDALITKLSKISEVVVRPTSAVLKYHNPTQEPLAAGREQGVEALLDGRVQKYANRVKVTVQLIRVNDGSLLWGGEFDEIFTNIFSVQDSISAQVVRALTLRLTSEEQKRLTDHYTRNIEAYQFYLQGHYFMEKRSLEGLRRSLDYYQQAINIDANYAPAYAGIAYSYYLLVAIKGLTPEEGYPPGKKAALKALELDHALAEGYAALARFKDAYDHDVLGAGEDFRRALEINPNDASTRRSHSSYLFKLGRIDEALSEAQKAQEIDPLLLIANANLAEVFYHARQWDQTLKYMRRVRELDANFRKSYVSTFLYLSYMQKGMYEEAVPENAKRLADGASPEKEAELVLALTEAYRTGGESGIWRKQIELAQKYQAKNPDLTLLMAEAFSHLGNKDETLRWLNRAADENHPATWVLRSDPDFDSLRSDPRFGDLLQRIGSSKD
jgi:DNA-binding winged helix-turn-helix (wHTH) protein/TolB-like protein/tetratricopeptide (TPR) repeat protein